MARIGQLLRRLSGMTVSLLGLSVLIFVISRVLPGNPARMALGAMASDEQVAELAAEMGLDKPLPLQYVEYMRRLFVGDLGQSLQTKNSVARDLVTKFPATLELITLAFVFMVVFGIPLGIVAAKHHGGILDNATRFFAFSTVSVPSFFVGIVFQLVFGYFLNWFPITGRLSSAYSGEVVRSTGFMLVDTLLSGSIAAHVDAWTHILLPALALSFSGMGQIIRITRSSMIDVEGQDYIEAMRGYGLPTWMVTDKYTLKNAFVPTLTILGLQYAWLLSGAFIIEIVYSWPGLAKYGVQSVLTSDVNAVVGVTMLVGVVFVVVNFVVDLLTSYIDPRIGLAGDSA
ncbi:ABC transporter permease [Haloarcula sp. 1CSR25-25]|uniref:ABC transporter permease n=1 Tax=Haloarcula sp. 1CSR25-25 TaxID=2862545 RepID=UPI002893A78F|nr:ABC transporter permease [Haloarcula sp. 1CSR25-25]MDT3437922.1 ABC transporter permease [Haloarcula sp. 1CSR25-25]